MPNLVGIGNTQVPTNAMLGGLAYQDPAHALITSVEIGNIAAIRGVVDAPGTLRDLFVYDTSRDSDGGAWRKRCRNTSWENESLGTGERGSRREFPAVAILAVSTGALVIYDGDDPHCSMWMKILVGNSYWLKHTVGGGTDCTCVYALNGQIVTGGGTTQGRLSLIDFPGDYGYVTEQSHTYNHDFISRRHLENVGPSDGGSKGLTGNMVQDVVMWVNPWAPINQKSGLPQPTIAAATTGGVSFINDGGNWGDTGDKGVIDGTSSSSSAYSDARQITTTPNGWVWWNADNQGDNQRDTYAIKRELQSRISGDFTWSNSADDFSIPIQDGCDYEQGNNALAVTTANEGGNLQVGYQNEWTFNHMRGSGFGGPKGWGFWTPVIMKTHENNSGRGMVAQINSWSTSGLLPCVAPNGAVYCATTETRVLGVPSGGGTNILTNGDFSDGTTGWYGDSGANVSESGGVATVTNGGGDNTYAIKQNNVFKPGRKYKVTGTITPTFSGSYTFRVRAGGSSVQWSITSGLTSGSSYNFDTSTITADGTPLEIGSNAGTMTQFTIDNIVVAELGIEDVASYRHTADVVGNIDMAPVSTGAELCGVGPFNSSNYAGYNTGGVNYGNPARYTMMGWMKTTYTGGYQYICSMHDSTNTQQVGLSIDHGTGKLYHYNSADSALYDASAQNLRDGKWHHVAGVYDAADRMVTYVDGKRVAEKDPVGINLTAVSRYAIGYYFNGSCHYWFGNGTAGCKVALVKFSEVAITDEQMQDIYEIEKSLFYENAQCTIYGTSDSVTALAYDPVLKRYHVGTSAGRSDFDGLRRINNTTTAVTTAIAACDGLIVDQ